MDLQVGFWGLGFGIQGFGLLRAERFASIPTCSACFGVFICVSFLQFRVYIDNSTCMFPCRSLGGFITRRLCGSGSRVWGVWAINCWSADGSVYVVCNRGSNTKDVSELWIS